MNDILTIHKNLFIYYFFKVCLLALSIAPPQYMHTCFASLFTIVLCSNMNPLPELMYLFISHSYVERLLDRISNGTLADDRRTSIMELQSVVSESHAAQLAFGAMG